MEIRERNGRWHAFFYVVSESGERKRSRVSTGIRVAGAKGTRAHRDSAQLARQRADELARIAQLEASGLRGKKRKTKTLEQAISELIARKELAGKSPDTIQSDVSRSKRLFEFFGPDKDVAEISEDDTVDLAKWAAKDLKAHTLVKLLSLLRQAIKVVQRPPSMPRRTLLHSS